MECLFSIWRKCNALFRKRVSKYELYMEELTLLYVYSMVYLHTILNYTESTRNMSHTSHPLICGIEIHSESKLNMVYIWKCWKLLLSKHLSNSLHLQFLSSVCIFLLTGCTGSPWSEMHKQYCISVFIYLYFLATYAHRHHWNSKCSIYLQVVYSIY